MRALISMAASGGREATTYSKRIFCAVMRRVVKCTSTWVNHTLGSDGHNGGSLTQSFATAAVAYVAPAVDSLSVIELGSHCLCQKLYINSQTVKKF